MVSPGAKLRVRAEPAELAGMWARCAIADLRCISIRESMGFQMALWWKRPVSKSAWRSRLRRGGGVGLKAAVTAPAALEAARGGASPFVVAGAPSGPSRSRSAGGGGGPRVGETT